MGKTYRVITVTREEIRTLFRLHGPKNGFEELKKILSERGLIFNIVEHGRLEGPNFRTFWQGDILCHQNFDAVLPPSGHRAER
jgi:hypothetical protein